MKKILSLLTILSLAGCEMPDYSQQTVEDKYPADPYVAKEKQADNSAKSPEKKKSLSTNLPKATQDADKSFNTAPKSVIQGKAVKPFKSENILRWTIT